MYIEPYITFGVTLLGYVYLLCYNDNTLTTFIRLEYFLQGISVLLNIQKQNKFYKWWFSSGLSDSNVRGFSTNGYPLFSIFKMPKLNPYTFTFISYGYLFSLFATSLLTLFVDNNFINLILYVIVFILSLLYFASLWAERTCSYHREIMFLIIQIYMVLSPSNIITNNDGNITLYLLKLHISSIYMASVMQKIGLSVYSKLLWVSNSPHTFMWKAMWSKPYVQYIQKFLFTQKYLMTIGGIISLFLESLLIWELCFEHAIKKYIYLGLLFFHLSIFIIQGIDYVSFWAPFAIIGTFNTTYPQNFTIIEIENIPLLLFLTSQFIFAFLFLENFDINIPPLVSCPMFVISTTYNDKTIPQYYVMTEKNPDIPFERLEWMYPFCKSYGMKLVPSDISKIPIKFVGFGWARKPIQYPSTIQKLYNENIKDGFFIVSNVKISKSLQIKLENIMKLLHSSKNICPKLNNIIKYYDECMIQFQKEIIFK